MKTNEYIRFITRPPKKSPPPSSSVDLRYDADSNRFVFEDDQGAETPVGAGFSAGGPAIYINPDHEGATDTRTGLSAYEASRPFVTVQAAVNAAESGDIIVIVPDTITENVTVTEKDITFSSLSGWTIWNGTFTVTFATNSPDRVVFDGFYLINANATPMFVFSGVKGRILLHNTWVSSTGALLTQVNINNRFIVYGGTVDVYAATTVTGTITLYDGAKLSGTTFSGAGTIQVFSGATVNGTLSTSQVNLPEVLEAGVTTHFGKLGASLPGPYANDAAAAAATPAVLVGNIYRVTGGTIAWRQV